jgi:hypothetical protein
MSSGGYYRMHRGWMDHPVLRGGKFSRRDAWVWLIEHASWTNRRFEIEGRTVELKRGQLTASVRYLATAWGWPKSVVARFITRLKTGTMIGTDSGTGQLIITICNYDKYQASDDTNGTPDGTDSGTTAGQNKGRESSLSKDKGAKAPLVQTISQAPIDPAGVIFTECLAYLQSNGVQERHARSLLGKWRSKVGEGQLIEIVSIAQRQSVSEPISWIEGAIAKRTSGGRVGAI